MEEINKLSGLKKSNEGRKSINYGEYVDEQKAAASNRNK